MTNSSKIESDESLAKQEQKAVRQKNRLDRREALQRLRDIAVIAPATYVLMRPSDSEAGVGSGAGNFS